jgi:uncharacterized membrane protein
VKLIGLFILILIAVIAFLVLVFLLTVADYIERPDSVTREVMRMKGPK